VLNAERGISRGVDSFQRALLESAFMPRFLQCPRIPETINESLLMNRIVGRVADRSACNRKENRIKRALNGAIIRGNGGEGARRNAQSGLCGVVMAVARNTGMRRDGGVPGGDGGLGWGGWGERRQELRRPGVP
jgi:hypothetical protein